MPFLPPKQQRQSTEGTIIFNFNYILILITACLLQHAVTPEKNDCLNKNSELLDIIAIFIMTVESVLWSDC